MRCAEFTSSRSRTSSWCPAVIRAGITDYLQFVIKAAKPYAPVAQRLAAAIRSSRTSDVVDLCSGAGGPQRRGVTRDASCSGRCVARDASHSAVPMVASRLFWAYVVPAIPLATLFDGIVSCLRTYTPAELMALTEGIDGYQWDAVEENSSAECR
jgi:hypothetical protein